MKPTGETKVVGILGWPVRHSLSPVMQQAAYDALNLPWAYLPFAVPPERLEQALRALPALGIAGVNCTIPHKEQAAVIVDELDDDARAIGAVNTVSVLSDGRLRGSNTDAAGFIDSLKTDGNFQPEGKNVVMIGTGGAGRAMAFGLVSSGAAKLTLVNRTMQKAVALAEDLRRAETDLRIEVVEPDSDRSREIFHECDLLVNSTSLGLRDGDSLPMDVNLLSEHAVVYDAVYVPLKTALLTAAEARGLRVIPGLGMLARQGARSSEIWTGLKMNVDLMLDVLRTELEKMPTL